MKKLYIAGIDEIPQQTTLEDNDVVHVLKDGRIVRTGGREIVDIIESRGFDGIEG